jgi:DNA-binding NarL/FixJ family response regulator
VSAAAGKPLVNSAKSPHTAKVDSIVAASSDAVRRELVDLTQDANFGVRAVAADPTALAELLRRGSGEWVVTGGSWTSARPFLSTARTANAAVVAVLSGHNDREDWSKLHYGGLAVLRAPPRSATFQAAVTASRAGLAVWDPEVASLAEAPGSIETPLSPRERTVLQLTGAGLSTKAVARQLGISPNTVKFHLQVAFEKLGVTSRAEAVMAAIRRGELAV